MDLLVSCNPKDLSQCDSVQRARDALERLRELARVNMNKTKTKKRITSWPDIIRKTKREDFLS